MRRGDSVKKNASEPGLSTGSDRTTTEESSPAQSGIMRFSTLGRTGLRISRISLGGVAFSWLGRSESLELIDFCLAYGINYIDVYGGTGDKIRPILDKTRKDFYISTRGNSKSIDRLLKEFNVGCFDIFFISMVDSTEEYENALREAELLEKEKRSGKFRFMGLATHNHSLYPRIMADNVFPVVMFPYNCVDELDPEVSTAALENNVGIVAMKPLAGGNLTNYRASLKFVLNTTVSTALIGMASVTEAKEDIAVLQNVTITKQDKLYYEQVRRELGKTFCRYCGHCIFPEPCPAGISVRIIMMLKTLAYQSNLKRTISSDVLSKVKECTGCESCQERCPYNLSIPELLPQKVEEYLKMTAPKAR